MHGDYFSRSARKARGRGVACQSAAVPRGADAQQIMSRLFGRVLLRMNSLSIPGMLGQRGGRVTGKWTLAPHYIKGGDGGRKSG
jgi:hypothetical protein